MYKNKSIQALQAYATGLAAQSLQHKVESKIFAAQGLSKLGEKYAEHAAEEMEWVDKFIDRILDLGGTPKVEAAPEVTVFTDPVEYIKSDVAVSHKEVPVLQQLTLSLQEDFKTFDILKAYALDEEEDMYWSETQLELIEKIGLQNWLVKQL
ncbi:MAG: bacterioferritin (cytochrome b1) [Bacteroidota bacterium]|nr:bacterioferritin (cytochrome b1) [Bacteroidota bacterium]